MAFTLLFAHPLARERVVPIGDARLLAREPGYPMLEALRAHVRSSGINTCEIKDDIVRIHN